MFFLSLGNPSRYVSSDPTKLVDTPWLGSAWILPIFRSLRPTHRVAMLGWKMSGLWIATFCSATSSFQPSLGPQFCLAPFYPMVDPIWSLAVLLLHKTLVWEATFFLMIFGDSWPHGFLMAQRFKKGSSNFKEHFNIYFFCWHRHGLGQIFRTKYVCFCAVLALAGCAWCVVCACVMNVTGLAALWEADESLRERLRKDRKICTHPMSQRWCEPTRVNAVNNSIVLLPALHRLRDTDEWKLPYLEQLQVEIGLLFEKVSVPVDDKTVYTSSVEVKKLLGFVKRRAKRHEVTKDKGATCCWQVVSNSTGSRTRKNKTSFYTVNVISFWLWLWTVWMFICN